MAMPRGVETARRKRIAVKDWRQQSQSSVGFGLDATTKIVLLEIRMQVLKLA
jgi:hypothetical protein